MRIQVTLHAPSGGTLIPFNSNHHLTSLIYRLLESSSEDYSAFLHEKGYAVEGKRFKLFTFSRLQIPEREVHPAGIFVRAGPILWKISSPSDGFIRHLVTGLLEQGTLPLGRLRLPIAQVETIPPPTFTAAMAFTCLSPITLSTKTDDPSKNPTQYCRLADDFSERIRNNLVKKYRAFHGRDPTDPSLEFAFDEAYLKRKAYKVTKLIQFKDQRILGGYRQDIVNL